MITHAGRTSWRLLVTLLVLLATCCWSDKVLQLRPKPVQLLGPEQGQLLGPEPVQLLVSASDQLQQPESDQLLRPEPHQLLSDVLVHTEPERLQHKESEQLQSEPHLHPLAAFLLDFLEWRETTSTVMYYSVRDKAGRTRSPPSWLDAALTDRLQRRLRSYVTTVPLPTTDDLLERVTELAHQSTSHVILDSDDVSMQFLNRMRASCMWERGGTCLVFSRSTAVTNRLASGNVPIDQELFVAEVNVHTDNITSIRLVEVYHVAGHVRVAVLARWDSSSGLTQRDERSIFARRGDWHGVQLRVVSIQDPPYTLLPDGTESAISGIVGNAWTHLAGALNFTYTVGRVPDGQFGMLLPSGNWSGLVGRLVEDRADVAVAALGISNQRSAYVDFTRPIVHHWKHVFMSRPAEDDAISGAFLFVFHWTLLLALALCTVIGWLAMAALYWIERHFGLAKLQDGNYGPADCLVIAMCAVFQQGPDYNPDGLGSRFLLWTMFVGMLMINASFSAVLTSYLAIKNEDIPIRDFDEFLQDGGYTLALLNNTIYLEDFQSAQKSTLQQVFKKHVQILPDIDSVQTRMKTDEKMAYLQLYTGAHDCNLFSFRADDFSPLLAIALQLNSPYRIFFDYHLSRLEEGGILDRLDRMWTYVPADQCQESNEVVASLPTVFTAFTALGAGVAASVALLAGELVWFRRKRDRARARALLLRWGGGGGGGEGDGQRGAPAAVAANPWKPAQAVAKFRNQDSTAKTGMFLQRVQKLQDQGQYHSKPSLVDAGRSFARYDDSSPTESERLLLEGIDDESTDRPDIP